MDRVDVVAVVGACAPERLRYAHRLAEESGRMLVTAARLARSGDPLREATELIAWADGDTGAVVELPSNVSMIEAIGALDDRDAAVRLVGVVCVVDAMHLLDDLVAEDFIVTERDARGRVVDCIARALLTVMQLEYAATIMLVNWNALPTPELSTVMAVASHLSPRARLQLQRPGLALDQADVIYGAQQDRAGWVALLNDEADPHMIDGRVSGFRYEQFRPLHPVRLAAFLDDDLVGGAFGLVLRSGGFCRFAARPRETLQWDHVGRTVAFHLAAIDDELAPDDELLALGQDLAFIGIDLDRIALAAALDAVALTDEELMAGPESWARFPNPFPTYSPATDQLE